MSKPDRIYPKWRKSIPVRVELDILRRAEQQIESCEHCTPDEAEIPFDYVLDTLTGCDPETTDYVLPKSGFCPRCREPLRTGFWRWYDSEDDGRKLFLLPGTLVTLKK